MQGNRIRLARELSGLTQTELGERTGTTQPGVASLESGRYRSSHDLLARIARETGFEATFFDRDELPQLSAGSLLYRSQASVKQAAKTQAHSLCHLSLDLAELLAKRLKSIPVNIPKLSEDPITSARIARSSLGLSPNSPVRNLVRTLEKNGVFVFTIPLCIDGLDGFSSWGGNGSARPVIALLDGKVGYRSVFTLAEELGHLTMHNPLTISVDEADKQARVFAQEFLLPVEAMELEMPRPVTLSGLADMKTRWGVALQFLAKRASSLGYVTGNQYRYLLQQVGSHGWRKMEPGDDGVSVEQPKLLRTMAEMLYGSPINLGKLSSESGLSGKRLRQILGLEQTVPRVLQFKAPSTRAETAIPARIPAKAL